MHRRRLVKIQSPPTEGNRGGFLNLGCYTLHILNVGRYMLHNTLLELEISSESKKYIHK